MGCSKRKERFQKRKTAQEANNWGKRLTWARHKLGLTIREVSDATDIPTSTISDWECGVRTSLFESIFVICHFYNGCWAKKFTKGFPLYEGEEVARISENFAMFGKDPDIKQYRKICKDMQIIERELAFKKLAGEENENQMNMFKD